jgi:pimeloyl-ACP methyl ester carboxylesterase
MESTARTVVFIHGLWMTPLCWEHFEEHFAAQGYHVMAPAWPGHDGDIGKVRDNAPTALAGLGLADIVSHFEKIVRPMDEQPILVGHSFGGLIVQILLDRGLGAAGIGMDSAPPKGVNRVPLAQLKASWPAIRRPANRHRVVALTFKQYKFGFANTMPEDEARRAYERYAVPDTARLLFQAALADLMRNAPTEIDYNDGLRKPLLLIAGGKDHTVPASVSKSNFHKYTHSSAVTDYHEFADRSHNIILEKGWEEVADYASEWLKDVLHLETMAEPVPDRDVLTSNRHTV